MLIQVSSIIFAVLTTIVIVFQACLVAGLPWGKASMGGKYPGKYPPGMRVVAVINILMMSCFTAVVFAQADLLFPALKPLSNTGIWIVVVFSAIGTVLNSITPSKIERIWAPLVLIQLITSLIVALN